MAGVDGFEPSKCRSQSPVPYRLAIPQYMDRRAGIEPTMFRNLARIEPDGQLPHSTTLVYLRIYKAHKSVELPIVRFAKRSAKWDLNP